MGLTEKIKEFYSQMEEKWYSFLDKVNEKIPVYGVIDEIDKVVPSLVVFGVVVLLLILGLGFFLFSFVSAPEYSFKVLGGDGEALSGVQVEFGSGEVSKTLESDGFGEIRISLPSPNVKISAQLSGFDDFSSTIIAKTDSVNEILLVKSPPQLQSKFLTILDDKGDVLSQPAIVTFSCASGFFGAGSSSVRVENGQEFEIKYSPECAGISATVSSEGFREKTQVLAATKNQLKLESATIIFSTADISVRVVDKQSQDGVPEILLRLISVFPVEKEVNSGRTNSSGAYSFEANPGKYFLRAIDLAGGQYKSADSDEFELEEDAVKAVKIELEKNSSAKDLLKIKVVDSSNDSPVANALVFLFDGNILHDKKTTSSLGEVSFSNLEEQKNYVALVTHAEFVAKVFPGLKPVDSFSSTPEILEIEKATALNSGSVRVKVSSAEGEKVSVERILLKNLAYNFVFLEGTLDSNGSKVFSNLPAGSYKAAVETKTAFAESRTGVLSAGQVLELGIELVLKQGFLKVAVFDQNATKLSNATVQVIDVLSNEVLSEKITSSAGETEKFSLPWNKAIYVKVSSSGFLPFFSRRIFLTPNATKNVDVVLFRESEAPSFDLVLSRVLDDEAKRPANSFSKDKSFFLEFNLLVPQDGFSGIESVVRTGLQSQLSSVDSNFVITGVERPLSGIEAVFSGCYNQSDDFAACDPINGNAKQLNLRFGALSRGVYEFLVKVYVRSTASNSENLEARFGAKAVQNQNTVRKPSSGLYLKSFGLGQPIVCSDGPPRCPTFGFFFTLSDTTGLHFTEKKEMAPGSSQELIQGGTYSLEYLIFNWSKQRKTYSNFTLGFVDALSTTAISINPASVQVPLLEPLTSFQGAPVTIQALSENPIVQFTASLSVPEPDSNSSIFFNVVPKKILKVSVEPKEIFSGVYSYLSVNLSDEANNPVNRAVIKLSKSKEFTEPFLVSTADGNNGLFVLEVPPVEPDTNVYLLVQAFGFRDSNIESIEVKSGVPSFSPGGRASECIVVNDGINDSVLELRMIHGQKRNFSIESRNCPGDVDVYIFQKAASDPLTLENLSTLATISDSASPSFTLSQNQKVELRLSADQLIGEYALFVQSKFSADKEFRDTARISVIVTPPSSGALSCYSLSKTSFNILPRDGSILSNKCAVFVRDAFYPKLLLGTENAVLDSLNQRNYPNMDFKVSSSINGTLAEMGQDSRSVMLSVIAPDTAPVQIDEEETAQKALFEVVTKLAAVCFAAKALCMKPQVIIPMVFMVLLELYSQMLGDAENWTCDECGSSNLLSEQLLLGTDIEKVEITGVTFEDGGYFKVHDEYIGIPETGPVPQDEPAESSQASTQEAGGTATPLVVLSSTGLQFLPTGGSGSPGSTGGSGSGSGGGGDIGGIFQSLIGGAGGGGGGGGLPQMIMQLIGMFSGSQETETRADSCGGHGNESTDCSSLNSGEVEVLGISLDIAAVSCTEINVPIDITDKFTPSTYNPLDLFVCNKINDGKAEITLNIKDSVSVEVQKDYAFVPQQDKVEELDVLDTTIGLYLTGAEPYADLSMAFSTDAENVHAFFDGKKLKAYFSDDWQASEDVPFEILNVSLKGEEFAVLSVDSYAGESPQPLLDLVYIVDSSKSFDNEWVSFCGKRETLDAELLARNVGLESMVYSIGSEKNCADAVAGWGDSIQPSEESIPSEAWGPAVQDVLLNHSWREGAKKFVLVLSDTTAEGQLDDNASFVIQQLAQGQDGQQADEETADEEEVTVEELVEQLTNPVAQGTVLSDTILAVKDSNAGIGFVFGVPVESTDMLSEFDQVLAQTKGFVKSFQPQNDEKELADLILKSSFELKHAEFHVRLVGGEEQLCRGPNDEIGVTGADALPKVLLSWDWEEISDTTCDQSDSGAGKYCDAVQFSKEVVKKLVKIKGLSEEGKLGEINSLTSFNTYLLKDSFSPEFFSDFDVFVKQKEFLPLNDYVEQWSKYVSSNARFFVTVDGQPTDTLSATGLYQANIRLTFEQGKNWVFFTQEGQPTAVIEVRLKLLDALESTNPFYSMPFDGMVGLNGSIIERQGYGVGFSGQNVSLLPQTSSSQGLVSFPVNGSALQAVSVQKIDSFDYVNRQNKGVLLSVAKNGDAISFDLSPNNATPVILEIASEGSTAKAFFEVRQDEQPVASSGFMNLWTGIASTVLECKDFEGNDLPLDRQDSVASGSACPLREGASSSSAYGFAWNAPNSGQVFLRTVFYTPPGTYTIRNACQGESLVITPTASSSESNLGLDFTGIDPNMSLKNLFDLVEEEKVCVSEQENAVKFWWNRQYLLDQLQGNADNYFNSVAAENENFRQCVVG